MTISDVAVGVGVFRPSSGVCGWAGLVLVGAMGDGAGVLVRCAITTTDVAVAGA